ncbi:MAG: SH3 domain-containing protein [Caldilinea sp.]
MQSSLSIPEETQPVSPPPTPPARKTYSRFWVGFVIGFGILLLASCSGIGIALGLNAVSLAELQGNGVVWTPPPYTPAPTLQPEADVATGADGSARFSAERRVRNLTNSRVNVRATPGYLSKQASDVIGVLEPGAAVTILGESQGADNLVWWRVQAVLADGRTVEGWVAEATASGVQILGE